jgi:hypothetical protein
MNDAPSGEKYQVSNRDALVMEFIIEVSRDVEQLRACNVDSGALDPTSWRRLQKSAHSIGVRAEALELGVLRLCAKELEQFAVEVLRPTGSDKSESIQGAMIALEMLDLELQALKRTAAPG